MISAMNNQLVDVSVTCIYDMFYLHSCEAKSLALFSFNSRINGILLLFCVMGESEVNEQKAFE